MNKITNAFHKTITTEEKPENQVTTQESAFHRFAIDLLERSGRAFISLSNLIDRVTSSLSAPDPVRMVFEDSLDLWIEQKDPLSDKQDRIYCANKVRSAYINHDKSLCLDNLSLTTIPECIGFLSDLEILRLNHNKLTTLPKTIGNLGKLRELRINHNQIKDLPETIGNLHSLEALYLQKNFNLINLPSSLSECKKLLWIDCNDTSVSKEEIYKIYDIASAGRPVEDYQTLLNKMNLTTEKKLAKGNSDVFYFAAPLFKVMNPDTLNKIFRLRYESGKSVLETALSTHMLEDCILYRGFGFNYAKSNKNNFDIRRILINFLNDLHKVEKENRFIFSMEETLANCEAALNDFGMTLFRIAKDDLSKEIVVDDLITYEIDEAKKLYKTILEHYPKDDKKHNAIRRAYAELSLVLFGIFKIQVALNNKDLIKRSNKTTKLMNLLNFLHEEMSLAVDKLN